MNNYKGQIPGRILCFEPDEYGKGEFCCIDMNLHINEKEKIVKYITSTREYIIQINENIIQKINYCPWCGCKLPDSLRKQKFDCLDATYPDWEQIPLEFKTDEWWKKRGL